MGYDAKTFPESAFSIVTNCGPRSEEHTSELQSRRDLVCRLLLEKKKAERTPYVGRLAPRLALTASSSCWKRSGSSLRGRDLMTASVPASARIVSTRLRSTAQHCK